MFRVTGALLAAVILVVVSCGGSGIPTSSISIRDALTNVLISTSTATGGITMTVGDTYQVSIERVYNDNGTTTSDVTTVSAYDFSPVGIASANALGVITALAAGTTTLEVRFRPSILDRYDRCYLYITVNP